MFSRPDTRPVRIDDLKLLYAVVKRAKVSPFKFIVRHWLEVFSLTGDIECTSLVTRIAQNLGLLSITSISYIDTNRWYLDYDYFFHAHMLKKRKKGQLIMMYLGYTNEIPLPN